MDLDGSEQDSAFTWTSPTLQRRISDAGIVAWFLNTNVESSSVSRWRLPIPSSVTSESDRSRYSSSQSRSARQTHRERNDGHVRWIGQDECGRKGIRKAVPLLRT